MRWIAFAIYNLLLPLAMILMLPGQWPKMRRRGGYGEDWRQRLARYDTATLARLGPDCWWVHAVSVGEVLMALKLITALRATGVWTGPIALTTTTSTGRALARDRADAATTVLWTPLDFPMVAVRAIRVLRPVRLVLVEAEVWPNLLRHAVRAGVPVRVVNARLSARSERRFRAFHPLIAPIFSMIDHVCVPDEADRTRFAALGIAENRISVTGAIKFDDETAGAPATAPASARDVLDRFPALSGARLLVAASTHPGEEAMVARAWLGLREKFPRLGLVVVPRHFERAAEVARDLTALGLHPARRSSAAGPADTEADCLIVDSTGELPAWLALAEVVVVGKSLAGHTGGQNPAEPVAAGRPTITGQRMDNFRPLVAALVAAGGLRQLARDEDLPAAIEAILADPVAAADLARRGGEVLARHRGATARTVAILAR